MLACANRHFCEAGGVGVVKHADGAAGGAFEECDGVNADPGVVDVGGGMHDAVLDDSGKGATDGAAPVEVLGDFGDGFGDGFRGGGLGRRHAEAVGDLFAGGDVDGRAFDAAASDVDS